MSRIFLDVGANTGQTLAAVLDSRYRFDRIFCFEPVQSAFNKLRDFLVAFDTEMDVTIVQCGLWNQNCKKEIYGPGRKGASLWRKDNHPRWDKTEVCNFVRASNWFKVCINVGDTVYLKLNCEGAECDILDDLLDSGEFDKVTYAMVDFDVRKIASQKHREAELRARLARFGFPRVAYSKQVMVGETHQARIQNWLRMVEA